MIRNIYLAIKRFFHNLFHKEPTKQPHQPQLVTNKVPPRYGRIKMNQSNHKRYRHTDPKEVAWSVPNVMNRITTVGLVPSVKWIGFTIWYLGWILAPFLIGCKKKREIRSFLNPATSLWKEKIAMKISLILLLILGTTLAVSMKPMDESPCEAGAPCARCLCMGDYYARLDDDEPDSENNKHPRNVCKNFCIRSCCKCEKPA